MKNQYPTFSMDAVRGADLIQRHKAGLETWVPQVAASETASETVK